MPENNEALVRAIRDDEARLNITWKGNNADLPDPVSADATDEQLKTWAQEAIRYGFPGMPADPQANLLDMVIDPPVGAPGTRPFPPTDIRPYRLFQLRPKTPFGLGE